MYLYLFLAIHWAFGRQYSGVNGGLALLHLSRMRQVNWDGKWREVLKRILRRKSKLGESDQVS